MTLRSASGSTGNPVQDGSTRAVLAGMFTAGIQTGVYLSGADAVILVMTTPIVTGASFVLGGLFDEFVKPRLRTPE